MKKLLFALLASLCFLLAAYLVYLNEVVLPRKFKSALISGLEDSTGKHVTVDSAKLDIFKGLVIKGLVVSDDKSPILAAKDITCRFLAIPVFKKELVITSVKFNSPQILLKRLPDNSINIVELFFKKPIVLMDGKFTATVSRIIISHGGITFEDETFEEPFTKDIKNANIDIRFLLPDKAVFNADFEIPSQAAMFIKSSGEYRILKKELSARIEAKDFYPKEFIAYCDEKKSFVPDGRIEAGAVLDYRDNTLSADMEISGMDMKFSDSLPAGRRGKVEAVLNGVIKAKVKYHLPDKELIYTGRAVVNNLALYNLDTVGNIYDIRGDVSFSDKAFDFNGITATVLGLPVKAKAGIADLQKPALKIDITSGVKLDVLRNILKNKFNIDIPLEMDGQGTLNLALQYNSLAPEPPLLNGSIAINRALFKSEYGKFPLEGVTGSFDFTQNQLVFKGLEFKYNNTGYKVSGTITNFQKPGVQLDLNSGRLSAKALFSINDRTIILSALTGRCNDYGFSIQGDIDAADPKNLKAFLSGSLAFELSEDKEPYKNFKDKFKGLRLSGSVKADFTLSGNLNDIPHSMIDGEVKCGALSLNNFKFNNFVLGFTHRNSVSNINYMRASFYGGIIEGSALINFASKDTPYQFSGDMKGVRIEELKKDTAFKDKDISGVIQTRFGVKGFSNDLSKLNGWGKLSISKGKLWQLDLFRGIGALLFRSDFGSVLFEEGTCDFFIRDKTFFTDNLTMKSALLNLYGTVKISFDKTIAASLKAFFTDEGVDAARVSDIAGVIERYSVIEVKGNLDEPKYKLRPDLSNVIGDIADNFLN